VSGTFGLSKGFQAMKHCSADKDEWWEYSFKLGQSGRELFQVARDSDARFTLFPAKHAATDSSIALRGPDNIGHDKSWLVSGERGEQVTLQLSVVDAAIALHVKSPSVGTTTYKSQPGWERYGYELQGIFEGEALTLAMEPDKSNPGKFRCRLLATFNNAFQILIDGDKKQTYYPEEDAAKLAQCLVCGPDGSAAGRHFQIAGFTEATTWEITLDLTTKDRRRRVSWAVVP